MRRKKSNSIQPKPTNPRAKTFELLQIHSQTGIAQDYLNKFLLRFFLEPLLSPNIPRDRFSSFLSTVRKHIRSFPTYRDYLRTELMASGYFGPRLSRELDHMMSQKNAAALQELSQKVRANLDGSKIDFVVYFADLNKAMVLIYGHSSITPNIDLAFISKLDRILN